MHFSIPETEEINEGGSVTLYKLHVNGAHHCSVRFSQLNNLNEQLKKEYSSIVPTFPAKKLFSLNVAEKEERRFQLEAFLQKISQIPKLSASDLFTNFFLNAQKETEKEAEQDVDITVYLLNSEKITVTVKSYEQTEDLLEKIMDSINLNQDFIYYFGIYLVKRDENDMQIIRKLQDFESPYISLKAANKVEKHRLLLRKSILDLTFEKDLYTDNISVNLLYLQALTELQKGWIIADNNAMKQLKLYQEKNSKIEYLKVISTQKFYGFLHFKKCICDYPEKNSKVVLALGNRTLNMRFEANKSSKEPEKEINLKVTRIRCWKINSLSTIEASGKHISHLELLLEYQFSKENMKWITIQSDQAILISMSLQNMVDEILLRQGGKTIKRVSDRHRARNTPFLKRDKSFINARNDSVTLKDGDDASDTSSIYRTTASNENTIFDDDKAITNDDL